MSIKFANISIEIAHVITIRENYDIYSDIKFSVELFKSLVSCCPLRWD